jgi:uncharacterized protein YebE (UPF0316 family)
MEFFTTNSWFLTWILIPLMIFCARVTDVSIGTVRIILVSKGKKKIAAFLGFIEVSIWLLAISQVMQHINNIACFLAYGLGFGTGNIIGIVIEEKIALGLQAVQFITRSTLDFLPMTLRDGGFGATVIKATGAKGEVNIIISIVLRKNVKEVIDLARQVDPNVFVSLQDIRSANSGFLPLRAPLFAWRRIIKKK